MVKKKDNIKPKRPIRAKEAEQIQKLLEKVDEFCRRDKGNVEILSQIIDYDISFIEAMRKKLIDSDLSTILFHLIKEMGVLSNSQKSAIFEVVVQASRNIFMETIASKKTEESQESQEPQESKNFLEELL